MLKLKKKLAIYKAKKRIQNKHLAWSLGVTPQTITNWLSIRCPNKIGLEAAQKLTKVTNGYIALKDCGHEEENKSKENV